jgi:hypothetical protein
MAKATLDSLLQKFKCFEVYERFWVVLDDAWFVHCLVSDNIMANESFVFLEGQLLTLNYSILKGSDDGVLQSGLLSSKTFVHRLVF